MRTATSGTRRGHRSSQASDARAKPILRSTPKLSIVLVSVASIASFRALGLRVLHAPVCHPRWYAFGGEHVVDRRSRASDRKSRAIDHHFGHQGAAVVAGSHYRPVGACRAYHDEIAGRKPRQVTVLCQIIPRFADRADNVAADRGRTGARLAHRNDVVPGFVERRTD